MQGTPSQQIDDLYRRYCPSLYRRARMLTGEPAESKDLAHQAFVSFMEMMDEGALSGELKPYAVLFTIVTNKSVDRLRMRARWTGKLDLRDDEDFERTACSLEVVTAHEGYLSRVDAAQDLALLTQGEKPQVLTAAFLYFVEGHTLKQVGQVLSLSRQVVSEMLSQFLKRARTRRDRLEATARVVSP
ncbi:RNA polymerase sigma factor [Archangium gephyra]|nr:sigma-70 family RNA polymerase sigma factor [Archangium gephyra]